MAEDSWIAIQRSGYYTEACIRKGYMTEGQSAVIGYKQFIDFMNGGEVTRPVFVSMIYTVCLEVAGELNDSALAINHKKWVEENA